MLYSLEANFAVVLEATDIGKSFPHTRNPSIYVATQFIRCTCGHRSQHAIAHYRQTRLRVRQYIS